MREALHQPRLFGLVAAIDPDHEVISRTHEGVAPTGEPHKNNGNQDEGGPPLWMRLAQAEIAVRSHVDPDGRHTFLDHALQMEVRLTSAYPGMPFDLRDQFEARLATRGYTEEAWDRAVSWLGSTDWFKSRGVSP